MNGTDGIARLAEVESLTGLSRSSVYRLEAAGRFPKRRKLSARLVAWPRGEVIEWLESRPIARPDKHA
jgi:prophage regulatory protein